MSALTNSRPALRARLSVVESRVTLTYDGYIDEGDDAALAQLEERVMSRAGRSTILFVQGRDFAGFHRSQVGKHASAISRMRDKLAGVAIANATGPVRFAIASVAMLSKVPLKGFEDEASAHRWLDDQARAKR